MTISWRYETIPTTESSNSDLLHRWHEHTLVEPVSLLALEQTAGRGRRGKTWISQAEDSLTFSMAYPFPKNFTMMQLQGLSLVCGLCILKSILQLLNLSESTGKHLGLGLKWPNDILLNHRKLAGVLVEGGQKSPNDPLWMIIGVGLNLRSPPLTMGHLEATSIAEINPGDQTIDAQSLYRLITINMGDTLDLFSKGSFSNFQDEWNHWDVWHNQMLSVHQEKQEIISGISMGVNKEGYLLLNTPLGIKEVAVGDLSLSQAKYAS
jgi:BirA family biotin operon repressor/biotin-[acetyl-CoA-carboxylase] ligase